jgi:hypothetical protein
MFDITLNECFKYSLIIVSSPEDFSEDYCLICENQGGFRKGYSTTDNLFVIYMLISIMQMFDITLNECLKYSLIIVSSPEDLLIFLFLQ